MFLGGSSRTLGKEEDSIEVEYPYDIGISRSVLLLPLPYFGAVLRRLRSQWTSDSVHRQAQLASAESALGRALISFFCLFSPFYRPIVETHSLARFPLGLFGGWGCGHPARINGHIRPTAQETVLYSALRPSLRLRSDATAGSRRRTTLTANLILTNIERVDLRRWNA